MPAHSIIPATLDHARLIAKHVRESDRQELWAAYLSEPLEVIKRSIELSQWSLTGVVDDTPICIFGVVVDEFTGVGRPWMIGTESLDEHAGVFLRHCRGVVRKMRQSARFLVNHVDARNTRAIEWLQWLGFRLDEPLPWGPLGIMFRRFTMGGNPVEYRRCTLEGLQASDNFNHLIADYSVESSIAGLPDPCAQMGTYQVLESLGSMQIIGAFDSGKLVGFVTVLISPLPHYGVTVGITESLFVQKEHRKKGIGACLLRMAEQNANERGGEGILVSSPSGGDLEKVLNKKKSYKHTNTVFFKRLK